MQAAVPYGLVAAMAACGLVLSGCGAQYRPVVSAINPVGPAGQPTKYAIAISNTTPFGSPNPTPGLATVVDVSGDTILATPSVLPFPAPTTAGSATVAPTPSYVNPLYFTISNSGSEVFLINQQGLFESFFTSNPTALLTQDIVPQTLATTAPIGVQSILLPSSGQTIFVSQPATGTTSSGIAELQFSSSASLLQNLNVTNPVYTVGADNAARVYAISGDGYVVPIENSPISTDPQIPVGTNPVYGIMTADGNRAFILNKGSGTVTVINVPSNAIDSGVTNGTITLPLPPTGGSTAANPVWVDLLPATNAEMVVLNQGDGVHPGSLTTISIPLCNQQGSATNPNCNSTNPVDASGFGAIVNNIAVGVNPSMVSVLQDNTGINTRAYVVNQGILPGVNPSYPNGIEGSISVVNLSTHQVITIPGISNPATAIALNNAVLTGSPVANNVFGHPNTVVAITGTPTGKVYTTSTDSQFLTVLETDTDSVATHISLQGTGIRVVAEAK